MSNLKGKDYTVQCSCGTSGSNTRIIDGTLSVRET